MTGGRRNIKRFNDNDLIELSDENFKIAANDLGLITSNNQKYCYLLSERGYTKLVSMIMKRKAGTNIIHIRTK